MTEKQEANRLATEISKRLADEGKLIEAGWVGYRMLVLPKNAPQIQIDECRMAFMAGSQHLFHSIAWMLDPGDDATDADERKMELIDKELRVFVKEMEARLKR